MGSQGLYWSGSGLGQVAGTCEWGDELCYIYVADQQKHINDICCILYYYLVFIIIIIIIIIIKYNMG
jgi:hypothetical protein